jgi:hypothetical protein
MSLHTVRAQVRFIGSELLAVNEHTTNRATISYCPITTAELSQYVSTVVLVI